jgi:hypothetical protein
LDNDFPELDALFDEAPVEDAQPEEPASSDGGGESVEEVQVQPEVAVAETPLTTPEVAPVPDITADLEAIKARLAQAEEKAGMLDQLQALARQKQAEALEQERFAAWQSRMDELEELPKAQREAEKQRILAEVRSYRDEQYQSEVAQQETVAEEAAKAFAAIYSVLPNYLSPEQLAAAQADAKHLLQLQSPDAMKAQIARDKALEARGYERAKAELAKAQEAALATQAQARIASNADLVGARTASPTVGDEFSIDQVLDSVFG